MAVLASTVPLISAAAVRSLTLATPSATPLAAKVPLLEQLKMTDTTMTSWVIMFAARPSHRNRRPLNGAINDVISEADVRELLGLAIRPRRKRLRVFGRIHNLSRPEAARRGRFGQS